MSPSVFTALLIIHQTAELEKLAKTSWKYNVKGGSSVPRLALSVAGAVVRFGLPGVALPMLSHCFYLLFSLFIYANRLAIIISVRR